MLVDSRVDLAVLYHWGHRFIQSLTSGRCARDVSGIIVARGGDIAGGHGLI